MSSRRPLAAILPLLATALALLGAAASASSTDPLMLTNLRVLGGEDSWHPDDDFRIEWDAPPIPERELPIAAVVYRIRDASGNIVVGETRVPRQLPPLDHVRVPPVPGRYTADVWLEGTDGSVGPQGSVSLLFDDARPGATSPIGPSGWVSAGIPVSVRLAHPTGAQPLSGIRGYAVSVDRSASGSPCVAEDRCADAELDLRGGIEDDTISLGELPEGADYVHAVAVSGSGRRSATVGTAVVRVDTSLPSVVLDGAPAGWASGSVRLTARATDPLSGMEPSGPDGPFTAIAVDGRVPAVAPGDSVSTTVIGSGLHRVGFYGRDAAGNLPDRDRPAQSAVVRIDEAPPTVDFARGQDPREPERIEAGVADTLSGPDPLRGSIALRPVGSRRPFEPLPTTASAGRLTAHWDSDSFPAGDYEFRATGYDAAGNATSSLRRSDGARMVLANPLKAQTQLVARLGGRHLEPEWTAAYGRSVPFEGRLSSISGAALAGLPVEIVERFGGGASATERTTTVATGADGRFLARLPAGPSRVVEARFAGNRTLTRADAGGVQLRVRSAVKLRVSAPSARVGGPPVVFSGRVGHRGASIPPDGLPVALQFRLPGLPWTGFRTVYTDSRGRFRYPYAFSDDDSRGVRFRFRAYVPANDNWPYQPAGSRPLAVTGR
jgi:hypothetical protein